MKLRQDEGKRAGRRNKIPGELIVCYSHDDVTADMATAESGCDHSLNIQQRLV